MRRSWVMNSMVRPKARLPGRRWSAPGPAPERRAPKLSSATGVRIERQRPREPDALALAPNSWENVDGAGVEADERQEFARPLQRDAPGDAMVTGPSAMISLIRRRGLSGRGSWNTIWIFCAAASSPPWRAARYRRRRTGWRRPRGRRAHDAAPMSTRTRFADQADRLAAGDHQEKHR